MNYRRGLFRFWLICSLVWVAMWFGLAQPPFSDPWSDFIPAKGTYSFWTDPLVRKQWAEFAQVALIPPAILYLIGIAALWIASGFSKADQRDQ